MQRASWLYSSALAATVAALFAAGGWLAWGLNGQLTSLDPQAVPVVAEVREAQLDYGSQATVKGQIVAPPDVLWNTASGTVTRVLASPDEELSNGSPIAEVDGVQVRAYYAETALFRALTTGARGEDVSVAQRILNSLLPDEDLPITGVYGWRTQAAVKRYEKQIGITSPTGVFAPDWFVLLPSKRYDVGEVSLQLGQPTPAVGAAVLTGQPRVTAVTLSATSRGPDGKYLFRFKGAEFAVARLGEDWSIEDLPGVAALLEQQREGTAEPLILEGRVSLAGPLPGQGVPAAALMAGESGATCVALADGDDAVAVTPLGSTVEGMAIIEPVLPTGAEVVVNPYVAFPGLKCP